MPSNKDSAISLQNQVKYVKVPAATEEKSKQDKVYDTISLINS